MRTLTLFGATARHSRYRATSGRNRFTLRTSTQGSLRATRARPGALRGSRKPGPWTRGRPRPLFELTTPDGTPLPGSAPGVTSGAGPACAGLPSAHVRRGRGWEGLRGEKKKGSCSRLRRGERGLRRVERGRLGTRGPGDAGIPGPAAVCPPGLPVPHHLTETQSPGRFSKSQFINYNKGINNLDAKVRLRRETDG